MKNYEGVGSYVVATNLVHKVIGICCFVVLLILYSTIYLILKPVLKVG
uniref:Uncharacterized protein n=1 Tax=Rhizophora mucronata TaxID=61149 RepID=A0A2P2QCL2_RHIMU